MTTTYDFETGVNGTAIKAADLGAGSTVANSGGAPTYSTTAAAHGNLGMACGVAGTSGSSYIQVPFTASNNLALRFYMKVAATPSKAISIVTLYDAPTGGSVAGVNWTTGNQLQWGGPTFSYRSSGTLTPGALYRVEMLLTVDTASTGAITVNVYDGDTSTLVGNNSYNTQTGINLGTNALGSLQIGVASGDGTTFNYDDIAIDPGGTTEIGPWVAPPAPDTGLYLYTGGQWVQVTVAQ